MTDKAISPLRQRMIEDMTIRKLAPKSQHDYLQGVKDFAALLGRSRHGQIREVRGFRLHPQTVRPSALAVLRLMTSSNLVACWTGRSPAFSPARILATYPAVER